jgi:hypothetical protein
LLELCVQLRFVQRWSVHSHEGLVQTQQLLREQLLVVFLVFVLWRLDLVWWDGCSRHDHHEPQRYHDAPQRRYHVAAR